MIINFIILTFILDYLCNDSQIINTIKQKIKDLKRKIKIYIILFKMKKQAKNIVNMINENIDKEFWS